MSLVEQKARVAETDHTYERRGALWVGKCLICNGPLAFDARTGEGATLEHIRERARGGTDEEANLGLAHRSCNGEKGVRWDSSRRRRGAGEAAYDAYVDRLLAKRAARWRAA